MAKKKATSAGAENSSANGENAVPKNWTIMLYLAGDNNLSEHLLTALDGIKSIANNSRITVLAQFDPFSSIQEARRFVFKGDVSDIEKPLVAFQEAISEETKKARADRAKPFYDSRSERHPLQSLKDFLQWTTKNKPEGDRTFLLLAGHGPIVAKRSFLLDKHPLGYVSLDSLRESLETHFVKGNGKCDFLAIDSCMVGGVEVAYELKDCADYLMASEGFTPSAGRPFAKYYTTIAKLLLDTNSEAEPKQVAQAVWLASLKHHLNYRLANHSFQGAVYDLTTNNEGVNKAQVLADAISGGGNSLVKALKDGLENEKTRKLFTDLLITAHWEAQSFWHEFYTDLYDFCAILRDKCAAWGELFSDKSLCSALSAACKSVMAAISDDGTGVVLKSDYIGPDYQYSYGMFILFPWNDPIDEKEKPDYRGIWDEYKACQFTQKYRKSVSSQENSSLSWYDFIQCYINKTRREKDKRHKSLQDDFVNNEFTLLEVVGETTKANAGDDCVCPTIKNYPQWRLVETAVGSERVDIPWNPSETVFTFFKKVS